MTPPPHVLITDGETRIALATCRVLREAWSAVWLPRADDRGRREPPRTPVLTATWHPTAEGSLDAVGLLREDAPLWLLGLISSGRRRAKNAA
jgi:hypothetical protein